MVFLQARRVISYLLPSSYQISANIPYSLAYRLKRIEYVQNNFDSPKYGACLQRVKTTFSCSAEVKPS